MKRYKIFIIFILLLILAAPPAMPADPVAEIAAVEGDMDITRGDHPAAAAQKGDDVFVGDILRTKKKARAEILYKDGSIMRMASETRFKIAEFTSEKEKKTGMIQLFRGKLFNAVKNTGRMFGRNKNRFEIHTSTAVVGVRGTEFIAYHQHRGSGAVFLKGEGYCYNPDFPEDVRHIRAGESMIMADPLRPPAIRPTIGPEIQRHMKDVAPIRPADETGDDPALSTRRKKASSMKKRIPGQLSSADSDTAPDMRPNTGSESGNDFEMDPDAVVKTAETIAGNLPGNLPENGVITAAMQLGPSPANAVLPDIISPLILLESDVDITAVIPPCILPDCTTCNEIPAGFLPDRILEYAAAWPNSNPTEMVAGWPPVANAPGSTGYFPDIIENQLLDLSVMEAYEKSEDIPDAAWMDYTVVMAGTYEATSAEPAWAHPLDRKMTIQADDLNQDWEIQRSFTEQYQSDTMIAAKGQTAWADLADVTTGIGGGKLAGLFDPEQFVWGAIETWHLLETWDFLNMSATESGRDQLKGLNIPCIEIGRTDLAGSTATLDVTMKDVTFFSYSTGGDPRIWASGDVSGDFHETPAIGHQVDLTGNSLSAQFTINQWRDQTWAAGIDGSGSLTRADTTGTAQTTFSGAAVGTHSGGATGEFSGTASGICVKNGL